MVGVQSAIGVEGQVRQPHPIQLRIHGDSSGLEGVGELPPLEANAPQVPLLTVTECWVDTALQLGDRALATMERLVRAQNKRFVGTVQPAAVPALDAARA